MTPWVVDAAEINLAKSVQNFQDELFHTNRIIDRFMDDDNTHNLIVVATKGYGKTLLVKAKRLQIENLKNKEKPGIQIIPTNALVDKPISTPRILSYDSVALMLNKVDYWKDMWLISIIMAVCKRSGQSLDGLSDTLQRIADDPRLVSVFDIFGKLLGMTKREVHQAQGNLLDEFIPTFRSIHTATYVFIDNVDEYFTSYIMASNKTSVYGLADKSFWYIAQVGLAVAARELSTINPHVKICASLRAEAMRRSHAYTDTAIQLKGRQIEIKYSREDLFEIMKKNIRLEKYNNLASPRASEPFARFFGQDAVFMTHTRTGEVERIEEYVIRHTLGRPRDIAMLGSSISEIAPERRSPDSIAYAINSAAREIVKDYSSEIEPHLQYFDLQLACTLIPRNILTREEVISISKTYDDRYQTMHETKATSCHLFCSLYKVGLLGYVSEDRRTKRKTQVFCSPGDMELEHVNILPEAEVYLIHPILDEYIATSNNAYWNKLDKLNIVGNGRPWRTPSDATFVLQGDVVASSGLLTEKYTQEEFLRFFRKAVKECAKDLDLFEVSQGDSVMLMDANPTKILTAAADVDARLAISQFGRRFRFGGDCLFISFLDGQGIQLGKVPRGRALVVAQRVQRISKQGDIFVTGEFVARASEFETGFEFIKLTGRDLREVKRVNGWFDVSKGADPAMLVELYWAGR